MATKAWFLLSIILSLGFNEAIASPSTQKAQTKPHIVLMVADDLGWNDVSWHNPKVETPHLEQLAEGGVILEQSYVQPICTPTRAALMTGRYPYTIGRQRGVLWPEEPVGLSMKRKLLPEALKDAGYSTHAVGKWHLGFCSWDYTPTSRGFDTFWGYYTGAEDYYHHSRPSWINEEFPPDFTQPEDFGKFGGVDAFRFGYDFRNNTKTEYSVDGVYSTYTFASYIENLLEKRSADDPLFMYLPFQSVHAPLEVPENYTKPFSYVKNKARRTKLGMVLAMDEAVGRVVEALKKTGHYDNSVIVFTTDNGGPTVSAGNNWPLRGNKSTLWEGGTRGAAFVHSPLLPSKSKGTISDKLVHVTDWYATLVGLGGGVVPKDSSGYDQWLALTTSTPSPRREMIYNLDYHHETRQMDAGIRMGDYKLLVGNPGPGEWIPPPEGRSGFIQDMLESEIAVENTPATEAPNLLNVGFRDPIFGQEALHFRKKRSSKSGPFIVNALLDEVDEKLQYIKESIFEDRPTQKLVTIETYLDDSTKLEPSDNNIISEYEVEDDDVTLADLGLYLGGSGTYATFLDSATKVRLYHIRDDPTEKINVATEKVAVVKTLIGLIQYYMKDYVEPDILPNDPHANPAHWNNTWSPGWCQAK